MRPLLLPSKFSSVRVLVPFLLMTGVIMTMLAVRMTDMRVLMSLCRMSMRMFMLVMMGVDMIMLVRMDMVLLTMFMLMLVLVFVRMFMIV